MPHLPRAFRPLPGIRLGSSLARRSRRTLMTAAFVSIATSISMAIAVAAFEFGASAEAAGLLFVSMSAVLSPCAALLARREALRTFFSGDYGRDENILDRYLERVEVAIATVPNEQLDEALSRLFHEYMGNVEKV